MEIRERERESGNKLDSILFRDKYISLYEKLLTLKEMENMILFTILALVALFLIIFTVVAVSIGGAAFIIIFGDIIVCIAIIVWIIKKILKK